MLALLQQLPLCLASVGFNHEVVGLAVLHFSEIIRGCIYKAHGSKKVKICAHKYKCGIIIYSYNYLMRLKAKPSDIPYDNMA